MLASCIMSDLADRLDSLLRRYAAECGRDEKGDQPWKTFRNKLRSLIAAHGPNAVDPALDEIPDGAPSSVSLR
jgi:hypothetical protein